jgi:hypothetical protein
MRVIEWVSAMKRQENCNAGKGKEMGERCSYPKCSLNVDTTWALVGLCMAHRSLIHEETIRHYQGTVKLPYEERTHYLKIVHLIPFARSGAE